MQTIASISQKGRGGKTAPVKALKYDKWPDKQEKLWELREKIKANLDKFIKKHLALFK